MIVVTAQQVFDSYLREIDKQLKETVRSKEQAIIMAEALMVKVKELFLRSDFGEDHALLFMEHALHPVGFQHEPKYHNWINWFSLVHIWDTHACLCVETCEEQVCTIVHG